METITLPSDPEVIRQTILNTKGTIFGATVKKRSTGEIREFNARVYEDTDNGRDQRNLMMTVIEMNAAKNDQRSRYRTISLEGVKEIRHGGKRIRFSDL